MVFFLSGKGMYGPFWPTVYALLAAVVVCAAIYSSDPIRYRSGIVRRVLAIILVAASIALITGEVAGCAITILLFLGIFAVPLVKAEKRARKAIARNP